MKIVIAPDSFKDSLSAQGVADAIALGLVEVWPDAQLVKCPMADGGEGTVESILAACDGVLRRTTVRGPLGVAVDAAWGWLPDSHTAIIEMAEASGLQLVAVDQRDACISSTFGTGELIRTALDAGAQRVILAIGGSATNDAGAGAMQALGVKLLDAQGQTLAPGGLALTQLARIDLSDIDPRLAEVRFDIAADVNNPLCGPHGASAIFGPQKAQRPRRSSNWIARSGTLPNCAHEPLTKTSVTNRAAARRAAWGLPPRPSWVRSSRPGWKWSPSWSAWLMRSRAPTW